MLTEKQRRLVEAASAIRSAPPHQIDFQHTVFCQCGIPHTNPGETTRAWERKQGIATLRIEAGSAINPRSGNFVSATTVRIGLIEEGRAMQLNT